MLTEVDNWDLRVHHRKTTRVQNRRNVEVRSLENQPKPHTGKDGFLCHTRLGLVGWISYWSLGYSALTVIILVSLIKTLGCCEGAKKGQTWCVGVSGSMSSVEKKFDLQVRKWEEYRGTRYYDGDSVLGVELWLQRLLTICQDSHFRTGTPQRVVTMQVLR